MGEHKKRNIILIAVLFLIVLLGLISLFFGGDDSSQNANLSGFPEGGENQFEQEATQEGQNSGSSPSEGNFLTSITKTPIAGYRIFKDENEDSVNYAVYYAEAGTGHIYEYNPVQKSSKRLSAITIPQVGRAMFLNKDTVALQYISNGLLTTFLGTINPEQQTLTGTILPYEVEDIVVDPNRELLVGVNKTFSQGAEILTFTAEGALIEAREIPLRDVGVSWGGEVHIQTRASKLAPGYLFSLGDTGLDIKVGGQKGLTTLSASPQGPYLNSFQEKSSYRSVVVSTEEVVPLTQSFLPEKCVWSKDTALLYCFGSEAEDKKGYPDDWYMGLSENSDDLFEINPLSGGVFLIDTLGVDAMGPSLSPQEDRLFFIDRKTGRLYEYKLFEAFSEYEEPEEPVDFST